MHLSAVNISEKWYNLLKIHNLPNTKHEKLIHDKISIITNGYNFNRSKVYTPF